MNMFYRSYRQIRWNHLEKNVEETRNILSGKLPTDSVIECDKCGCLLKKTDKWKRPSTVEKREKYQYRPSYQVYTPAMGGLYGDYGYHYQTIQTSGDQVKVGEEEYLQEHYVCGRCWKGDKK